MVRHTHTQYLGRARGGVAPLAPLAPRGTQSSGRLVKKWHHWHPLQSSGRLGKKWHHWHHLPPDHQDHPPGAFRTTPATPPPRILGAPSGEGHRPPPPAALAPGIDPRPLPHWVWTWSGGWTWSWWAHPHPHCQNQAGCGAGSVAGGMALGCMRIRQAVWKSYRATLRWPF